MTHDDLIKLLGEWVRVSNPHAHVTWTGQLVGLADDPSLLLRTGPGQQATLPQSFTVEHLELDPASDVDDEHGKPLHCRDCAQAWLDGKPPTGPTHPPDGPSGPQDGRESPAAGTEPPEGPGGAQAGAGSREAFREQIAALFRHPPGAERLGDATPGGIADAVLAVHHRDTAQLRRERDMALAAAEEARGAVEQITALRDDLRGITGARWIADSLDKILNPTPPVRCQTCKDRGVVPNWQDWNHDHGEPRPKPCPDCKPKQTP